MRQSARPARQSSTSLTWIEPSLLARFAASDTDAHRLASSPLTWVERYGPDILVSYRNPEGLEQALAQLKEWSTAHELPVRRIFGRFLPKQNEERSTPDLIEGDTSLPLQTSVREEGLVYDIDFSAGYSAGLFFDQRANRAFLRSRPVTRLLNTFAYTCSFSVVAASAGAETVSVDLSRKSVDRGRLNFGLNGLPQTGHQFIADDVLDVLPRLARRGEKFDAIIIDPPTFSRGNRGRRFQVQDHLPDLLNAALELADKGARILLSTNCTRITARDLEWLARSALKHHRRPGELHREPSLPDIPAELAAKTVWLLLR